MKKTSILFAFIFLSYSISSFAKNEPYLGQFLAGTIGKFGLGTEIILPKGEWVVAGVSTTNGGIRWAELVLIQTELDKIKTILYIKYPRKLEKTITNMAGGDHKQGWTRAKHVDANTCDDYSMQNSNFNEVNFTKRFTSRIFEGTCISVYAINKINPGTKDRLEVWRMTHEFINRSNLEYPNSLVFVDNTYFSLNNVVHSYFAINPEFQSIASNKNILFKDSDWHKYNINSHPKKKSYMDKVTYIGRQVLEDNQVNFLQERALNFLPYGELY